MGHSRISPFMTMIFNKKNIKSIFIFRKNTIFAVTKFLLSHDEAKLVMMPTGSVGTQLKN
jgi:hypothetical protein